MDIPELEADVRAKVAEWVAMVRAEPDPDAAFAAASQLWRLVQDGAQEIAAARAEALGRIREARELNLSELARHVGVSPQRIHQLTKKQRGDQE